MSKCLRQLGRCQPGELPRLMAEVGLVGVAAWLARPGSGFGVDAKALCSRATRMCTDGG